MQLRLHSHPSVPETGYQGGTRSPGAIGAAIAVHLIVAGAVILMPPQTFTPIEDWGKFPTRNIPLPPETKPDPPQKPQKQEKNPVQETRPISHDPFDLGKVEKGPEIDTDTGGGTESSGGTKTLPPVHIPILIEAQPDPAYLPGFQPEYPGAMVRAQKEGKVTVRVHISAQGRVEAIDLIDASDPAFWRATRDQALRRWRFRPATRDGEPVPGERIMTVRFRLSDLD